MDSARKHELLIATVEHLLEERGGSTFIDPGATDEQLWGTFRSLVNVREATEDLDPGFMAQQNELLQGIIDEKGVDTLDATDPVPGDPRLRVRRGDITTLAVDAVVNAANSKLLGCWIPGHFCIDNAIHTYAGVQLRRECMRIMNAQGHDEPTGQAKLTMGWNLPARHVIHTVGPIANGEPTDEHRGQLASCYRACLDLARESDLHSIAFCGISTGVFGFPVHQAAPIAISTVTAWLDEHPEADMTVVFNAYSESDEHVYRSLLGMD